MTCRFRYVHNPDPALVSLRLFYDTDGVARAEVTGPTRAMNRLPDRCVVNSDAAITAAIRIANCNDVEVVVMGDLRLWDPAWGTVVRRPPVLHSAA